jgi:hypothetical protein
VVTVPSLVARWRGMAVELGDGSSRRGCGGGRVGVWAAGCTPAAEPAARSAAEDFQAAGRGDATAACGLLSEAARQNLESASVTACAQALTRLQLPGGRVAEVAAWGEQCAGPTGVGGVVSGRVRQRLEGDRGRLHLP